MIYGGRDWKMMIRLVGVCLGGRKQVVGGRGSRLQRRHEYMVIKTKSISSSSSLSM